AWLQRRRAEDAARAATLIGLALSVKYTPIPTLVFFAVLLAVAVVRAGQARASMLRLVAALCPRLAGACGVWFVKEPIRYGNPFYPLYFGHRGVSEVAYRGLIDAIQQFGPRTLHAFLRVPYHYARVQDILVFLSFYVAPFALLIPRARRLLGVLLAY